MDLLLVGKLSAARGLQAFIVEVEPAGWIKARVKAARPARCDWRCFPICLLPLLYVY